MFEEGMVETVRFFLQQRCVPGDEQRVAVSENDEQIPDFWYFLWDKKSLDEAAAMWRLGRDLVKGGHSDRLYSLEKKRTFELQVDFADFQANARAHRRFMQTYFLEQLEEYDCFIQVIEANGKADDRLFFDLKDLLYLDEDFEPAIEIIREKFDTIDQNKEPRAGQFRLAEDLQLYGAGDMCIYPLLRDRTVRCCRIKDHHLRLEEADAQTEEAAEGAADAVEKRDSDDGKALALLLLVVLVLLLLIWLRIIRF